ELCVLQVATDEVVAAIDCLAPCDLDPLFDLLLAEDKVWVLHSARQDLEVLYYRNQRLPNQLIDTQIAAGLTGMPAQIGLQNLLAEVLEVDIGKQHTRANWSRRPLTDALKQYALDDVRYLLAAWHALEQELDELGRLAWFHEDCARQLALPIEPDTASLYDKIKGAGSLRGKRRATASALVEWREERAKTSNRPRRWILADDQLVRIATTLPRSTAELEAIPNLPPRLVARSGSQLLEAIEGAEEIADAPQRAAPDRGLVKALQEKVRSRARELGIQPELLATRRDIARIAAEQTPDALPAGWRRAVLAELLESIS
ncbi:MAG: HRDC domain-containing protein, partial [Gammaproteobacteria bacterium]